MELYYAESLHGEIENMYGKRLEKPLGEWMYWFKKNCIHLGFDGECYKIVRLPSPNAKSRERKYTAGIIYLRPVK